MSRAWLCILAAIAAIGGGPASAADYPTKPIRIVVGYAPGGAVDLTARVVAQKLTESMGQQVLVENRTGASGSIGVSSVVKAAPDGYTLLVAGHGEITANPALFPDLQFSPERDLTGISVVTITPFLLVANPNAKIASLQDFIAQAKARPGQITWSSAGSGSANHLAGELFGLETGVKLLHVPYKGAAPAAAAVASGEVATGFVSPAAGMSFVKADKLKVLALTLKKRPNFGKEWPTVAESGYPNFDSGAWIGLFAPPNTPVDIVNKLNSEVKKMLSQPDVIKRLDDMGFDPIGSSPAEIDARVKADVALYTRIIREGNIRPQ